MLVRRRSRRRRPAGRVQPACPARQRSRRSATSGPVLLCGPSGLFLSVSPSRTSVLCISPTLAATPMRRQQPGPQLLQGDVRPPRHLGRDRSVMRGQLERLVITLRPRLALARGGAPAKRLVDVGDADLELPSHAPGRDRRRQLPPAPGCADRSSNSARTSTPSHHPRLTATEECEWHGAAGGGGGGLSRRP